jgi:hypothetical protein
MITKIVPDSNEPDQIWLVYFEHKGASANIAWLQDKRDAAYLYDMKSINKRKGEASELLQEINEFCLNEKIFLIIRAEVFEAGKDGIQTNEELKDWYEKNGAFFVNYDEEGLPLLIFGAWKEEL